jgi:hypothetical protein
LLKSDISNTNPPLPGERIETRDRKLHVLLIPLLVSVYFMAGFTQLKPEDKDASYFYVDSSYELITHRLPVLNFAALLANEEFSRNLRDTVYTDADKYLELRIDEQMLYVHYRDGKVKEYPVSSGNKYLNKGIESRPGLFAIFMKEELHLSSQFDDAKMFYYMPFNMGIGFHSLAGTGYYGNLGVRPSSHGCIRMRTADVKELFKECEIGTLVLAHRGKSARVIAFAPEGFKNEKHYSKDEYMEMLAYNLNSIYHGKYFINPPKRFIIDPAVIPKIGFNVGTSDDIQTGQEIPVDVRYKEPITDRLNRWMFVNSLSGKINEASFTGIQFDETDTVSSLGLDVDKEMIDKLAYNKIGILPYFPPTPKVSSDLKSEDNSKSAPESNSESEN